METTRIPSPKSLPNELLCEIFEFLEYQTLQCCSMLNQRWTNASKTHLELRKKTYLSSLFQHTTATQAIHKELQECEQEIAEKRERHAIANELLADEERLRSVEMDEIYEFHEQIDRYIERMPVLTSKIRSLYEEMIVAKEFLRVFLEKTKAVGEILEECEKPWKSEKLLDTIAEESDE